jgi:hypothetical protein
LKNTMTSSGIEPETYWLQYTIDPTSERLNFQPTTWNEQLLPIPRYLSKCKSFQFRRSNPQVYPTYRCTSVCWVHTMSKVEAHHSHDEALRGEHLVLGEPEHQTLQHLVAGCTASLPQKRPQVVAAGLATMSTVVLVECHLRKTTAHAIHCATLGTVLDHFLLSHKNM